MTLTRVVYIPKPCYHFIASTRGIEKLIMIKLQIQIKAYVSLIGLYLIVKFIHNHPATDTIKLAVSKIVFFSVVTSENLEGRLLPFCRLISTEERLKVLFSATQSTAIHNGKHTCKADQA
jgi:hypothetical protein